MPLSSLATIPNTRPCNDYMYHAQTSILAQNSLTYQNSKQTAKKNNTHTFQPTPVFSAMISMRFMVPRKRILVFSKPSFIRSVNLVESRISSPIASVISFSIRTFRDISEMPSSFCDSSSDKTASEYWPRPFGVALRYSWLPPGG